MTKSKTTQVRIDNELVETLERIRKEIALKIKKEFDVDNVEVNGTLVSRILAKRLNNNIKTFDIKVKKKKGKNSYGIVYL